MQTSPTYHFWLYILLLEDNKYYVGITRRKDPQLRINQHYSGFYGAKWTKLHKPVKTIEVRELGDMTEIDAEIIEKQEIRKLMEQYGYQNVRGGDLSYSGEYVKRFNRFFTKDNWEVICLVSLQSLAIIYLAIDRYFLHS